MTQSQIKKLKKWQVVYSTFFRAEARGAGSPEAEVREYYFTREDGRNGGAIVRSGLTEESELHFPSRQLFLSHDEAVEAVRDEVRRFASACLFTIGEKLA